MIIDDFQPLLRHGTGTMHDEVGVWQALLQCFQAADDQNFTAGRLAEFIGAMTGADGHGQGIDPGLPDELDRFVGICQQPLVVNGCFTVGIVLQ